MTLAEQARDFVASPKPQTYGQNEPRRVKGATFNHELAPVVLPPGFATNRRVLSASDATGDRLALGMAQAHDFARVELGARGVAGGDLDAVANAATSAFVRGFGAARRIGPSREIRETEPVWAGVFGSAIDAFRNAPDAGRFEALGAAVAERHAPKSPRLDVVYGQLAAAMAVAELLDSPAASPGKMPRVCDRDWSGERLRTGVAFARTQATSSLRWLGVTDLAGHAERAARHYSAGFACFVRLERFGRSDVQRGEVSGDGIKRAILACLPLSLDPTPRTTPLDVAYAIGDQAIDCVVGDAGSSASCAGQVLAALAVVTALATVDRDEAARLCAAARKDTLK